jgi:YegS/Rv2252/BmrU family lipid kinase
MPPILFIVNPAAGSGRVRARWTAFERELRQAGMSCECRYTNAPGHAQQLAQAAAGEYEIVVAVGGDGACAEVASGLLTSQAHQTVMGVAPFGTGNDTPAVLGVNSESDSRRALQRKQIREIDAIRIHCTSAGKPITRHALLFGAVGIVSEGLKRTTPRVKRLFGQRLAYPAGILSALCKNAALPMRVKCDGREFENRFLLVSASNSEIAGGGMRLAPGALIDDGLLNVNVVEEVGRCEALRQLWRVRGGGSLNHPKARYFTARNLEIETEPPLDVAADGELVGFTPVRFEVRPKALRVLSVS